MIMTHDGTEEHSPAEIVALPEIGRWLQDLESRGVKHQGVRLRPAGEAVTVRVRDGEVLVSDGPFADTKEQIAGYEIIELADLDQAIEIASEHPTAARWAVEIRPFWEG